MFGKNPIRPVERYTGTLAVQEIFYTVQGEGPHAGRPAVFIRLAGCNLACTFCDTEFESGINNRLTVDAVVREVVRQASAACKLVVITGGEPFRQPLAELCNKLLESTFDIQIETAGTLWQEGDMEGLVLADEVQLVCSPKTPKIHPKIARFCEHYKYIIQAGRLADDGLPVGGTQQNNADKLDQMLYRPDTRIVPSSFTIWVSPCDEHDLLRNEANVKAAVHSALRFGYRLTLQMHKIVGLP